VDPRAKDVWPARAGLPLGLAFAALAVTGWTVPAGDTPTGAATTMTVGPTGSLGVAPAGEFARKADLRPGGGVAGRFEVTNQSGDAQRVALRMDVAAHDLDEAVHVKAALNGRVVTDGSLGAARRWSDAVVLRPGQRAKVRVRLTVPAGAAGYEYRRADARIELRSETAR
jgi:hypothetical protein